uniref:Uncharacterized protein n=1 Tax=Pyxicephalus adspersus TaxID=30357 RepID=A0AAV3BAR0_PYXAD|nr:TPA: hypothetical protein GDO54_001984 [Pyxicephalus adspersus]
MEVIVGGREILNTPAPTYSIYSHPHITVLVDKRYSFIFAHTGIVRGIGDPFRETENVFDWLVRVTSICTLVFVVHKSTCDDEGWLSMS